MQLCKHSDLYRVYMNPDPKPQALNPEPAWHREVGNVAHGGETTADLPPTSW